jgi:hypothetical protein
VTTTGDADSDVNVGYNPGQNFHLPGPPISRLYLRTEFIETKDEDWLINFESQDFGLDKGQRLAVDLDETFSGPAMCDGGRGLLLAKLKRFISSANMSEQEDTHALNTLGRRHGEYKALRAVGLS